MKHISIILFGVLLLQSCIGDDVIDDRVDEKLRITNQIDTLGVEDSHQLEFIYTNNVGKESGAEVFWQSSDPEIASIDDAGIITGISAGNATIHAEVIATQSTPEVVDSFQLVVDMETIINEGGITKTGTLRTTSSYVLQGDFVLSENEGKITLTLAENFITSDALPGLYVYLTNNPTTTNGSHMIGPVTQFEGMHSYDIIGDVGIEDYQYVLMFCKPFNVKVGDGLIEG